MRIGIIRAPALQRRVMLARTVFLQLLRAFTDLEFQDVVNSGLLVEIEETVAAGAAPAQARKWWTGELLRVANDREVELADLPVTSAQIRRVETLVADGSLNDKLALLRSN